jgi:hypothetical protein
MFWNRVKVIDGKRTRLKGASGFVRLFPAVPGVLLGMLVGVLLVGPHNERKVDSAAAARGVDLPKVEHLSPAEIQDFVVKALSTLGEQQGLSTGAIETAGDGSEERSVFTRKDVQLGVKNIRRLLPLVKGWTIDALLEATTDDDLKRAEWPRMTRLIRGVRKIVRSQGLWGIAAVRDSRLTEILVDPDYAPHLTSDDEAVFVLAHELTHVAARSGKLERFIERVAERARSTAQVETTEDQKEDLACDFVGELVLKQFIVRNPTNESAAVRVSRVLGYESPAKRFARAWQDFCASYNGDPGDDNHLNQYQTIRALIALDPHLQALMPMPANPNSSVAPEEDADCR